MTTTGVPAIMREYTFAIPFAIIFTKGDKMGPNALAKQIDKMKGQILEHWEELPPTFVSSSETGLGRDGILNYIEEVLNQMEENNKPA